MSGVFTNRAGARARRWSRPAAPAASASGTSRSTPTTTPTSRARWPTSCSARSTARAITSSRRASCQRFVPAEIPWAHVDLSSATRTGGLGARQHRGHRLRRALRAGTAPQAERPRWHWTASDEPAAHAARTTGTCTCAMARRCAPCCPSPPRASRAPSSCRTCKPPVTTTAQALAYRERILAALPAGRAFEPLMTLYLTDRTDPAESTRAKASGFVHGFKLYPAGATTHSDAGVTDIRKLEPVLARMSELGPGAAGARRSHRPGGRRVRSRGRASSTRCWRRWRALPAPADRLRAHHHRGGAAVRAARARGRRRDRHAAAPADESQRAVRRRHPPAPLLPAGAEDRARPRALLAAVASGNPRLFLGTDSAPHARTRRRSPAAAPASSPRTPASSCTRRPSNAAGALPQLEGFAAFMARISTACRATPEPITLVKEPWDVPAHYPFGADELVPLRAGERIGWRTRRRPAGERAGAAACTAPRAAAAASWRAASAAFCRW